MHLEQIDVLKVDVEGFEPLVLQGAQRLLKQQRIDAIICEMNDPVLERAGFTRWSLISQLGTYGLTPQVIPPTGARKLRRRPDIANSGDLLFTRLAR